MDIKEIRQMNNNKDGKKTRQEMVRDNFNLIDKLTKLAQNRDAWERKFGNLTLPQVLKQLTASDAYIQQHGEIGSVYRGVHGKDSNLIRKQSEHRRYMTPQDRYDDNEKKYDQIISDYKAGKIREPDFVIRMKRLGYGETKAREFLQKAKEGKLKSFSQGSKPVSPKANPKVKEYTDAFMSGVIGEKDFISFLKKLDVPESDINSIVSNAKRESNIRSGNSLIRSSVKIEEAIDEIFNAVLFG